MQQISWGLILISPCDLWNGPKSCYSLVISTHDLWSRATSYSTVPAPTLICFLQPWRPFSWWQWASKPLIQLCHFCGWHLGGRHPLEKNRAASHCTSVPQKSLAATPTIQSFLPLLCKWSMLWIPLNSRRRDPRSRTNSSTYRLIYECTGPLRGRTPINHAISR